MNDLPITRRAVHVDSLAVMPYRVRMGIETKVCHRLPLRPMCPVSGNPAEGSSVQVGYVPFSCTLEVVSLRRYLDAFIGGVAMDDGVEVIAMEEVIERLAQDAAAALRVRVEVEASLVINPDQHMNVETAAQPPRNGGSHGT